MTSTVIQNALDRLPGVDHADGAAATRYRRHLEAMLCSARLQEAIDRAERWYAEREATLRRFDRRAAATVRQLVAEHHVRPSLTWSPA